MFRGEEEIPRQIPQPQTAPNEKELPGNMARHRRSQSKSHEKEEKKRRIPPTAGRRGTKSVLRKKGEAYILRVIRTYLLSTLVSANDRLTWGEEGKTWRLPVGANERDGETLYLSRGHVNPISVFREKRKIPAKAKNLQRGATNCRRSGEMQGKGSALSEGNRDYLVGGGTSTSLLRGEG